MSHSRIIQLAPVPIKEDDLLTPEDLNDDYKVNAVSEYVDTLDEDEQQEELEDLQETETFNGTSVIDGNTVTFSDCDTLKKKYDKWFDKAIECAKAKSGTNRTFHGSDLRNLFSDFKGDTNLFVLSFVTSSGRLSHRTALRSAELIAELAEREDMPRKWFIGSILDSKDA